jgi:acyl-CoA thioesterase-1
MNLVFSILAILSLMFSQVNEEPKTIIFYGDSITAGYGIGTEFAFPELVRQKLIKNGFKVEIVNAGLSGETSAGGVTRIDWILSRKFDLFILELGANDGLRGIPITETKKNLKLIINKVQSKFPDTKILITGMMVPPNMGEDYSLAYQKIFSEIAMEENIDLMPFLLKDVAGLEELNQPDGIHPNLEGHRIIANNIYPYIVAMF